PVRCHAALGGGAEVDDDADRGGGELVEPRGCQGAESVGAEQDAVAGGAARRQRQAADVAEVAQPLDRGHQGARRVGPRKRNVTSRIESWPSSSMSRRASPMPKPPCGGAPYRKKSR